MKLWHIFPCICLLAWLTSCKPTVPRHIIQPDDMEDILFDYHVADAMATLEYGENADYNARLYKLGVLKKHGVTEADFDSAMVYYTRHADRLRSIYENLATRMTNEAMALGADANDVNRYQIADGDTANIWSQPRNIVMMTEAPYNVVSFHTDADSSYHKGDRFVMAYDTKFLYQDGMKNGVAQLVVRFANDSIATKTMHMSTDRDYSMEIADNDSVGVKNVKAFIYLGKGTHGSESTLKVMLLNNTRIIKCHPQKKPYLQTEKKEDDKTPAAPADSQSVSKEVDDDSE